jgi:hypothetical protein
MAVMANSMEIPQKIKIELPYDSAIPLLNIYIYISPRKIKSICQKHTVLFLLQQYS